jgi:hypothetical protein
MFIRFREMTAQRYGDGARECVGECKDRPRYYPRYGVGAYVKGRTFLQGCPMKPLCPLAQPRHRLEVSIVETRREGGKVRQKHIASLGSIAGDNPAAREHFWLKCEARLARLSNRIGPDLDRLRQAIAARISPLTDAEREATAAAAWNSLESMWDRHAKDKARAASNWNQIAKQEMREAIEAEVMTLKTKRLRGKPEAFDPLNMLLGLMLCDAAMRTDHGEERRQLKGEVDALLSRPAVAPASRHWRAGALGNCDQRVATEVRPDQPVGDVLSEKQLSALRRTATAGE